MEKSAITAASKSKSSFRSRIMKYAWQIFRATQGAWRACMLQAWKVYRLLTKLRSGAAQFLYRKSDGTIRQARGTLANLVQLSGKKASKPSYKTLAYYDLDRNAFRCFKIENLLAI